MFASILENVRAKRPLVHNITNYVTANDCANLLLACGASPIMADDPLEAEEVTALSQGLHLNLGTLHSPTPWGFRLSWTRWGPAYRRFAGKPCKSFWMKSVFRQSGAISQNLKPWPWEAKASGAWTPPQGTG